MLSKIRGIFYFNRYPSILKRRPRIDVSAENRGLNNLEPSFILGGDKMSPLWVG